MSVFEADIEIHVYVCHVGRMLDPRLDRHIYVELTSCHAAVNGVTTKADQTVTVDGQYIVAGDVTWSAI